MGNLYTKIPFGTEGDFALNRKQKKALTAALAGIMATGVTGGAVQIARAAMVENENEPSSNPATTDTKETAASGDKTASEAPETIYKVLINGANGNTELRNSLEALISRTKAGAQFKAEDVQEDVNDIQNSSLVKSVTAQTLQSNGKLYVVFNVTPKEQSSKASSGNGARNAAGWKFEPRPEGQPLPQVPLNTAFQQGNASSANTGSPAISKSSPAKGSASSSSPAAVPPAKTAPVKEKQGSVQAPAKGASLSSYPQKKSASQTPAPSTAVKAEKKDAATESFEKKGAYTVVSKPLEKIQEKDSQGSTDSSAQTLQSNVSSSKGTKKDGTSNIDEDKLPIVEDIVYDGNKKTKSWVLDKIVSQYVKKGDKIHLDRLQSLYDDLYSRRYFKDLDVKLEPGKNPNSGIVKINMKEDKTGEWSFGMGASTQDKVQAIGSIKDYNLGGRAQTIGLDFGIGTKRTTGEVYYSNPYLGHSDTALTINGFRNEKDLTWSGKDYTEKRNGASIGITKPLSKDKTTKFYSELSFDKITTDKSWIEDVKSNTITLGFAKAQVDNIVNTRKGYAWDIGTTVSTKALGSDRNFSKYHLSLKSYAPVGKKGVFASRFDYNYSPDKLPFLEQFTVGGVDSIRGLDEDEQRGNKAFLGTIEYRHTLNDWLQAVAFVDFGQAWSQNDSDVNNSFKVAPGVGLRAVTKMGILRFDAAKANGHSMKFVFGIGQSF